MPKDKNIIQPKLIKMTYDEFIEKYKPIQNTITNRDEFNGWMFETYGEDDEYIRKVAQEKPNTVWTIYDDDTMTNGWHYVNRFAYFITEVPFEDNVVIEIDFDED